MATVNVIGRVCCIIRCDECMMYVAGLEHIILRICQDFEWTQAWYCMPTVQGQTCGQWKLGQHYSVI